jgi:hypothetical protein
LARRTFRAPVSNVMNDPFTSSDEVNGSFTASLPRNHVLERHVG